MIAFSAALALVAAVQTEPLEQRMAPRAVALEISKVAESLEEAAKLAVMAWEEGRLIPNAIGDHGRSLCVYQLQRVPWTILRDLRQCTRIAAARLRASAKACPSAPLAVYASGSCGRARALSATRMAKASALLDTDASQIEPAPQPVFDEPDPLEPSGSSLPIHSRDIRP